MFKSTIITLLTIVMAFNAVAAPVPVPATGTLVDAKGALNIFRRGMGRTCC